ncbi:hypothetical protein CYY_008284 [Polysphondylium violaceum]|uniref:Conserved oligomeric Golgi complex subunit 3 n=1 Tax=Polysphondylium violaceum TaxID=133409 RepID=A0A8J4PN66_9MYCE|nr:hypothetical protein CYY_008284 [Polysphondylium violaceum]
MASPSSSSAINNSGSNKINTVQSKPHFDISVWEKKSKLTTDQYLFVNDFNRYIQEKPIPVNIIDNNTDETISTSSTTATDTKSIGDSNSSINEDEKDIIPKKPIENLSDFYQWFSKIDKSNTHLHQYEWFLETIVNYSEGSDQLLSIINNSQTLVDSIETDYLNLTKKTNQLNESCEKFFKEELKLRYIVQSIQEKSKYFNQLESYSKKFNSQSFNATDPNFFNILESLENSISFIKSNASFMESSKYLQQYVFFFTRALGLMREYISSNLKILTKDLLLSEKNNKTAMTSNINNSDNSVNDIATATAGDDMGDINDVFQTSNIKFRAFSPKIRPLCLELEKRAIGPYSSFLLDAQMIYFQNRRCVLAPIIAAKFQSFSKMTDINQMIRHSSHFMMRFFENEYQIYQHFFSTAGLLQENNTNTTTTPLTASAANNSGGLSHSSSYNSLNNLNNSTNSIHSSNNNMNNNSKGNNNGFGDLLDEYSQLLYDTIRPIYIHVHNFETLCNLAHLIRHELIDDLQENSLRYCNGFKNTIQRMLADIQERLIFVIETYIRDEIKSYVPKPQDLDYPNKLKSLVSTPTSTPDITSPAITSIPSSPSMSMSSATHKTIYYTWYPTLEKSLTCLSKLYLVLETKIFEGLAQEVVEACSFTLVQASRIISQKNEPNIIIDSQLFLIKHLLTLREQIAPFDINFVVIEKIVDFPNLKHSLSTLYNVGSLLSLSANNPILTLLSPRVTNTSIDSKKDLEKELKQTIESFILSTANSTIDQLLSLLTKISVFLNQCIQNQTDPKTLPQQAFADVSRIKDIVGGVKQKIISFLPEIYEKMKLYLTFSTQNLLMKPMRTNIIDSFDQINQYTKKYYTEEQIKSMDLISTDDLKKLLDSIFPIKSNSNQ